MADDKKYYYLKLKDNFYDQDHIKYIESMTHGYIYSNILMKLYLKAIRHEGCLRITEEIPYDPENIEPMAKIIGHDPSHVNEALNLAISLGILKVIDMKEMWFTDIQNYIGQSSTEADRKRIYRDKLTKKEQKALPESGQMSAECPDNPTPELELELELEKKKVVSVPHTIVFYFSDSYANKVHSNYIVSKKDYGIVSNLLKRGATSEEIMAKIDLYFTADFWFTRDGRSLNGFCSHYNEIVPQQPAKSEFVPRPNMSIFQQEDVDVPK